MYAVSRVGDRLGRRVMGLKRLDHAGSVSEWTEYNTFWLCFEAYFKSLELML